MSKWKPLPFSMVDSIPYQACPYPKQPDRVLFDSLLDDVTDSQRSDIMDIYFSAGRVDCSEQLINYCKRHDIAFECPVCGGANVRQVIEDINDRTLALRFEPCYCATPLSDSGENDERLPL